MTNSGLRFYEGNHISFFFFGRKEKEILVRYAYAFGSSAIVFVRFPLVFPANQTHDVQKW